MGWSQKRKTKDGGTRYRSCYRDVRGRIQSAGTFSNKRDSDKAWQRAEMKMAEGRLSDPRRGRQTFHRYVTEEWLPHHVMEVTTRGGVHIPDWQAHPAVVRRHADERNHAGSGPRMGN